MNRLFCIFVFPLALIATWAVSCTSSTGGDSFEENVVIEAPHDGVRLAGSLMIPAGSGPFPAVVLIHGTGNHTRDVNISGHHPFKVLAEYLALRGIASLRTDKRGCGSSGGTYQYYDIDNFVADGHAAVDYLRSRTEIDPRKVGLIGLSQGGLLAPMMAAQSDDVAFIVLLAGPGIWGKEFFIGQSTAMASAAGYDESAADDISKLYDEIWPILLADDVSRREERKAKRILSRLWAYIDEEDRALLGYGDGKEDFWFEIYRSEPIKSFLSHDPGAILRQVSCPVLALNGDRDVQISSKENLDAIESALAAGGNSDYEAVELPGLNHVFQRCETGLVSEYGRIDETIAPIALETVGDWILRVTGEDRPD